MLQVWTLVLRPVLSVVLFLWVFVYALVIRPIICNVLLLIANNIRLAVFPETMAALVAWVKSPPEKLFGVAIRDIDDTVDSRMRGAAGQEDEETTRVQVGCPLLSLSPSEPRAPAISILSLL